MGEDLGKSCFFVTPIGSDDSVERRRADGVYYGVLIPALTELGFPDKRIEVAHKMTNPGSITRQVMEQLVSADLVVADLTGLNPNVMYELAVRHATKKPCIVICAKGQSLPFDVNDERTIFYTEDFLGSLEFRSQLQEVCKKAISGEPFDNPIYRGLKDIVIQSGQVDEPLKYMFDRIMERLDSVDERVVRMEDGRRNATRLSTIDSPRSQTALRLNLDSQSVKDLLEKIKLENQAEAPRHG